jgi:hypothetical protein
MTAIAWRPTVASVQAALDGITYGPLSQAELVTGVEVRESLKTAGAHYDLVGNDGVLNTSTYAMSIQAWAAAAAPAWTELDRVCRAIFLLSGTPSNLSLAAFGLSGVTPWSGSTVYEPFDPSLGAAAPSKPNGFSYWTYTPGGTSGTYEPSWRTSLGATFTDGGMSWQCVSTSASGSTPIALPWDITQVVGTTPIMLATRHTAAQIASSLTPGLASLLGLAFNAWTTAKASQPAAQPTPDAISSSAVTTLNAAIAAAQQWIAASAVT